MAHSTMTRRRRQRKLLDVKLLDCPSGERCAKLSYMNSLMRAKDCLAGFKLQPVEERSNISVIHFETPRFPRATQKCGQGCRTGMTAADWDKFEKDIADAFEQVP
jgi:hypothetical protein